MIRHHFVSFALMTAFSLSAMTAIADTPTETLMENIKATMKPLGHMAKTGEFDAAVAQAKSADLQALLAKIPTTFEAEQANFPDIELDWEGFMEKAQAANEKAQALAEAAQGGDFATIRPLIGETGKSCKACHKPYKP